MKLSVAIFFTLFINSTITYGQSALQFDGTNDYVTFGVAPTLATQNFTVEVWFKRTATGTSNTTGTGGLTIVPILTKGSPENEASVVDANYILGLNASSNVIAADFEEGTGSASPGLNHPLSGTTVIVNNVWYHAAATFSNGVFSIYLNGVLENSANYGVTVWPQGASTQHAAIGTMIRSNGTTVAGFFAGVVDEARIWNYARTLTEIKTNMKLEITSGTGLLGRWGLNEGSGTTAANPIGGSPAGTLKNGPTWVTGISYPAELWALNFDGINQHIILGQAPELNSAVFTIECWFKRTGTGIPGTTGSGGITNAIPILTKGRNEVDGSNKDMNYWLGINNSTGTLAADFEDDATGLNHPVFGTTVLSNNTWYHAAASYNGTTWNLYLNGILETSLVVGSFTPQFNSIQHAGIGTALNSDGTPAGYFAGQIDEVRIWNFARPINEIRATINQKRTSGTGLIGRWGLDDGSGPIATNSISGGSVGSLSNAPAWTFGAPYNVTFPLVLQDGVNGYSGTRDTYLYDVDPATTRGAEITVVQDINPGDERRSLLKFDLSSLPAYSTIQSVALQFYVSSEGQGFTMHRMLKSWDEATISYSSNGGHFNADGVDAETAADASWPGVDGYMGYITVTIPGTTIKAWRDGYLANNGWLLIATHPDDGQQLRSREFGTTADRPRLSITYTPVPLPVKLTAFTAIAEGNNKVKVNWTTASEKNNSHFEVQRSADGVRFATIGTVAGTNNFSSLMHYSFYDNQPLMDISYYRLKQVDIDEKFDYSSIARVKISAIQNVYSIFPNPVQGNEFKIYSLKKIPENVDVKVYDLNGRLHLQKQFINTNLMTITHHLRQGLYTVLITGNTIKESFKILIH